MSDEARLDGFAKAVAKNKRIFVSTDVYNALIRANIVGSAGCYALSHGIEVIPSSTLPAGMAITLPDVSLGLI